MAAIRIKLFRVVGRVSCGFSGRDEEGVKGNVDGVQDVDSFLSSTKGERDAAIPLVINSVFLSLMQRYCVFKII
jgi:hypothetical protein